MSELDRPFPHFRMFCVSCNSPLRRVDFDAEIVELDKKELDKDYTDDPNDEECRFLREPKLGPIYQLDLNGWACDCCEEEPSDPKPDWRVEIVPELLAFQAELAIRRKSAAGHDMSFMDDLADTCQGTFVIGP